MLLGVLPNVLVGSDVPHFASQQTMRLRPFLILLPSCSAAAAATWAYLVPPSSLHFSASSSTASLDLATSFLSCATTSATGSLLVCASVVGPYLTAAVPQTQPPQHPQQSRPLVAYARQQKRRRKQQVHIFMMLDRSAGFVRSYLRWNSVVPTYEILRNARGRDHKEHITTTITPPRRRHSWTAKPHPQDSLHSSAGFAGSAPGTIVGPRRRIAATTDSVAVGVFDFDMPGVTGPTAAFTCMCKAAPGEWCNKRMSALVLSQAPLLRSSCTRQATVVHPSATKTASQRLVVSREPAAATRALWMSHMSNSDGTTRSLVRRASTGIRLVKGGSRTSGYRTVAAESSAIPRLTQPAVVALFCSSATAAKPSQQGATPVVQRRTTGTVSLPTEPFAKERVLNKTSEETELIAAAAVASHDVTAAACSCETTAATCHHVTATSAHAAGARAAKFAASERGSPLLHAYYNETVDAAVPVATAEGGERASKAPAQPSQARGPPSAAPIAAATSRFHDASAAVGGQTAGGGTAEVRRATVGGAARRESRELAAMPAVVAARAAAVKAFCRWKTSAAKNLQRELTAATAGRISVTLRTPTVAAAFESHRGIRQAEDAIETNGKAWEEDAATCSACSARSACLSCPSAAWSLGESGEEEEGEDEKTKQQWQFPIRAAGAVSSPRSLQESNTAAAGGMAPTAASPGATAVSNAATAAPGASSKTSAARKTATEVAEVTAPEETRMPNGGPQQELITKRLRERMEKQKYKLIGTHSAVKLCRWTKKQLQGIGGCYKHTFYGIDSHRCMEATTSIVCSNRCVFCWRHHTHPASKTFRWKADPPEDILEAAIAAHRAMIKPLRGMQGVTAAAYEEALQPRHCALSLIGEALMYPHINSFVELLHSRKISSFLVMNGQHPELLARLAPVTQLYVSVDAPNEAALKAIDRPLFSDFWERLLHSLDVLRERKERTVVRLTLIKDMNDDDVQGYGRLIQRGRPDFVEVKGVTFAGCSSSFKLSLRNSPHMQETFHFSQRLLEALRQLGSCSAFSSPPSYATLASASGSDAAAATAVTNTAAIAHAGTEPPNYQLASLHEHTNSVLLADANKFRLLRPEAGRVSRPCVHSARQGAQTVPQGAQREENSGPIMEIADGEVALPSVRLEIASPAAAGKDSSAVNEHTATCRRSSESGTFEEAEHIVTLDSAVAGPTQQDQKSRTDLYEWHTHIDFDRFFELDDHQRHAENYRAKTPAWASPAAPLRGFDPRFDTARYLRQIAGRPAPAVNDTLQQSSKTNSTR